MAGVFLYTLSALAYKEIKKNGEFVLPGFGKLVKQKRKASTGFNPRIPFQRKVCSFQLLCRGGFRRHRWPLPPEGQIFKFAPESIALPQIRPRTC